MNIQPLIEVNDEEFAILERLAIEHGVTVEQYLVRIAKGHVEYMIKADEEGYLAWKKTLETTST